MSEFTLYEPPPPPDITPLVGDVFISNERTYIVRTMEYAEAIGNGWTRPGFRVPVAVLAKACVLGPATTSKLRYKASYVHAGNQLPYPVPQIAAADYFRHLKEGLIHGTAAMALPSHFVNYETNPEARSTTHEPPKMPRLEDFPSNPTND